MRNEKYRYILIVLISYFSVFRYEEGPELRSFPRLQKIFLWYKLIIILPRINNYTMVIISNDDHKVVLLNERKAITNKDDNGMTGRHIFSYILEIPFILSGK